MANGGYVKTGSVGRFSFTVTAINSAGRSTTSSVSYVVSYRILRGRPPGAELEHDRVQNLPVQRDGSGRHRPVDHRHRGHCRPDQAAGDYRAAPGTKFAFELAGKRALDTFQLDTKGLSPGPTRFRSGSSMTRSCTR